MENCEESFMPWDYRELDSYLPDYDYQYDYPNLDDWSYPYHDIFYDDLDKFLNQNNFMEEDSTSLPEKSETVGSEDQKSEVKKPVKSRRKISTLIKEQHHFSGTRYLLLFTLERLTNPSKKDIVWVKEEEGTFEIRNQNTFAKEWGAHKNREGMTYDKVARSFRYYYNCNIIDKVPGVRRYKWNLDVLEDLRSCSKQ